MSEFSVVSPSNLNHVFPFAAILSMFTTSGISSSIKYMSNPEDKHVILKFSLINCNCKFVTSWFDRFSTITIYSIVPPETISFPSSTMFLIVTLIFDDTTFVTNSELSIFVSLHVAIALFDICVSDVKSDFTSYVVVYVSPTASDGIVAFTSVISGRSV